MEWNAETVLDALNDFERKPEIPEVLDQYLERIAKNGEIVFPWAKLKPLLKKKLEVVLDEYNETCPVDVPVPNFDTFNFDSLKKTILQAVESFTSAPFTIQRLCELVTYPTRHYNRTDKYMRGIEKNVLVVSTIEPRSAQSDSVNANIPVVNGMPNDSPRDDNDALNGHESSDSVSSSNANTPSNHVLLENFANVFPSAACIPPSSTICPEPEREIDSNFVETDEPQFEANSSSTDPMESLEAKDEVMDIVEDEPEQTNTSSDENTSTPAENQLTKDMELPEVSSKSDSDLSDISLDSTTNSSSESIEDSVSVNVNEAESDEQEADCPESTSDPPISEDAPIEPGSAPQDDTVSQSDGDSHISSEQSHDDSPEVNVPCEEITVDKNVVESLTFDNDASEEYICTDSV